MSESSNSETVDEHVTEKRPENPESSAADGAEEPESSAADGAEKPESSTADGAEKTESSAADIAKKYSAYSAKEHEASAAYGEGKPSKKHLRYKEKRGDLFQCPETNSLAHCVSMDLSMSKGIAATFKANFRRVSELKAQAKNVGDCAILQFPKRYVYYLITKRAYYHKPTYQDLEDALVQMRKHCRANDVKELSMPQLGCGLDRLDWKKVSAMIREVFSDDDISITVYIFSPKK